jgi:uncharacterized protein
MKSLVRGLFAWPLVGLIRLYQLTLGRLLPPRCRFHPSCSQYAIDAIKTNGPVLGLGQAAWRLARCGPWTRGGIEDVKPLRKHTPTSSYQKLESTRTHV